MNFYTESVALLWTTAMRPAGPPLPAGSAAEPPVRRRLRPWRVRSLQFRKGDERQSRTLTS
jgi:hypothetical protein